jgi:peroxiredoxin
MHPLRSDEARPELCSKNKYMSNNNTDEDPTACGRPQEYDASKEWANKKVVLFSVPGAFTPG